MKRRVCVGCWSLDHAIENHHTEGGGVGRKADYTTIIPLCAPCHREWHDHGRATFEAKHQMNATTEAARVEYAWQLYVAEQAELSRRSA